VVDQAITTTTTSTGILEVKGTDTIAKTAAATQDLPLIVAPALDLDTLRQVKSLAVTYRERSNKFHHATLGLVEAAFTVVAVRKHNSTFVEFITDGHAETIQTLNGKASLVRYPTQDNGLREAFEMEICAANATCSAFRASGVDVDAALDVAEKSLLEAGFLDGSRRLQVSYDCDSGDAWAHVDYCGWSWADFLDHGACVVDGHTITSVNAIRYFYYDSPSFPYTSKNLVFLAHGKDQNIDNLWDVWCIPASSSGYNANLNSGRGGWNSIGLCPMLKVSAFYNLVFLWVNSVLLDTGATAHAGKPGWSRQVEYATYNESEAALAWIICGEDTGPYGSGAYGDMSFDACYPGDVGPLDGIIYAHSYFKTMVIGFSDGGGFGIYLNWFHSTYFQFVHAIDYSAGANYNIWLTEYVYSATALPKLNAAIYYTCNSFTFNQLPAIGIFPEPGSDAPNTMPMAAGFGLTPKAFYTDSITWGHSSNPFGTGSESYKTWRFTETGCPHKLTFGVTGSTLGFSGAPGGDDAWLTGCTSTLTHVHMMAVTPMVRDLGTFVNTPYYGSPNVLCRGNLYGNLAAGRRLEEQKPTERRELDSEHAMRALSGMTVADVNPDKCLKILKTDNAYDLACFPLCSEFFTGGDCPTGTTGTSMSKSMAAKTFNTPAPNLIGFKKSPDRSGRKFETTSTMYDAFGKTPPPPIYLSWKSKYALEGYLKETEQSLEHKPESFAYWYQSYMYTRYYA